MFRKGTTLIRKFVHSPPPDGKRQQVILPFHCDIIKNTFWEEHHEILKLKTPQVYIGPDVGGTLSLSPLSLEDTSTKQISEMSCADVPLK